MVAKSRNSNSKKFLGKSQGIDTVVNQPEAVRQEPTALNLLPEVFQTEGNEKLFNSFIEDAFQPAVTENINFKLGRDTGVDNADKRDSFLPEVLNRRRQLESGIISLLDGQVLTAEDAARVSGSENDHNAETPLPVSVLDIPINPDKYINWSDYYWMKYGAPVIFIRGNPDQPFSVRLNIVNQSAFTTPIQANGRSLKLMNGMKIVFVKGDHINGNLTETIIADGTNETFYRTETDSFHNKVTNMKVFVNGIEKFRSTLQTDNDFEHTTNSLIWEAGREPAEGDEIKLEFIDYFVTNTNPTNALFPVLRKDAVWQVDGVGTPSGIRLLPLTMQNTAVAYSNTEQSLWDQTGVTWDQLAWDGDINGVNQKHYFLQAPGADNRNSFSRVNVWIHRDTISEIARYFDLTSDDLVVATDNALRPIVEFENSLQLFNHGFRFRAEVDAVIEPTGILVDPTDIVGDHVVLGLIKTIIGGLAQDILYQGRSAFEQIYESIEADENVKLATIINMFDKSREVFMAVRKIRRLYKQIQLQQVNNPRIRMLWLAGGEYNGKIITTKSFNNHIISKLVVESPRPGETTMVSAESGPNQCQEYHWFTDFSSGEVLCNKAQTRFSRTQYQKFSLYDRNNLRLEDYKEQLGIIIKKTSTTILELVEPNSADIDFESGYRLTFDTSNFGKLKNKGLKGLVKNAMYDLKYKHTMHQPVEYNDNNEVRVLAGPLQVRRLINPFDGKRYDSKNDGVTNGWVRSWYNLKSWAISNFKTNLTGKITLPADTWPTYKWKIVQRGLDAGAYILNYDSEEKQAHQVVFAGQNEKLHLETLQFKKLEVFSPNSTTALFTYESTDGIFDLDIALEDFDSVHYILKFDENNAYRFKMIILDPTLDPRAPKFFHESEQFTPLSKTINYDDNNGIVSIDYFLDKKLFTKSVTVYHQGQFIDPWGTRDHCTALPGLELNPNQEFDLGEFTPARMKAGFNENIRSNSLNSDNSYNNGLKLPAMAGVYMADYTSVRYYWAKTRLVPNLDFSASMHSEASWRWWRKLVNTINTEFKNINFNSTGPRLTADYIIDKMNQGVNPSSAHSQTGMMYETSFMDVASHTADGNTKEFSIPIDLDKSVYKGPFGTDHVYVYVDGKIQVANYLVKAQTVVFDQAPADGSTVGVFFAREGFRLSSMPASPAKLGLGPLYIPQMIEETWGEDNSRLLIQRHDGSRVTAYQEGEDVDIRDLVILEIEKRIYSSAVLQAFRRNSSARQKAYLSSFRAPADGALTARTKIQWFANNDIQFRERTDYDAADPFTWNYKGYSWRGMYLKEFGTLQLHTHPWEALGWNIKPVWWDTHYSWTDPNLRGQLEDALTRGIITEYFEGELPVQDSNRIYDFRFRRNKTFDGRDRSEVGFPVDSNGNLMAPGEWRPDILPTQDEAQAIWQIGSLGTAEEVWYRSAAGAWNDVLDILSDPYIANKFFEQSINPFVRVDRRSTSPVAFGSSIYQPTIGEQIRPTVGITSLLFEAARELSFDGSSSIRQLVSLAPVLQANIGGFTTKDNRIKMYFTKEQEGSFVPEEDKFLVLNQGIERSVIRYSAVQVRKEVKGLKVSGFDNVYKYFEIYEPIKTASTTRTVETEFGTFKRYTKHDVNKLVRIEYGHVFASKQELFDFFGGLLARQIYQGLQYGDTTPRGTTANWYQSALDVFTWLGEGWGFDTSCIVGPIADAGVMVKHQRGILNNLNVETGKFAKILFTDGTSVKSNQVFVNRNIGENNDTDYVYVNSDKQIAFINFSMSFYDHVLSLSQSTKQGDIIFDTVTNRRLDSVRIIGKRTRGWTGRPIAVGAYPSNNDTLYSFDGVIQDQVNSKVIERAQLNEFVGDVSKSNVVTNDPSILEELITDESVEFSYRQGLLRANGTNLSINALLRSNSIDTPGGSQDLELNEQWMFTDGEFGQLDGRKVWEFELLANNLGTRKHQVVRFLEDKDEDGNKNVDSLADSVIDIIGSKDKRWVTRDVRGTDFLTILRRDIDDPVLAIPFKQKWFQSAGVANLLKTNIQGIRVEELLDINNPAIKNNELIEFIRNIFGFSKFSPYQIGDLVFQEGNLFKCIVTPTPGENTVFQADEWEPYVAPELADLPSVWVSDYVFNNFRSNSIIDSDGNVVFDPDNTVSDDIGWNVLKFKPQQYVEEVCPNNLDRTKLESKVTTGSPHKLRTGDVVFISGSRDPLIDKFHVVAGVEDSFNFYINTRTTSNVNINNIVFWSIEGTKFKSLEEARTRITPTQGLLVYIEPDADAPGEYKVYKYVGTDFVLETKLTTVLGSMVDSHSIDKIELLDGETGEPITPIEIYDPYKGLTIDDVTQHIDFISYNDPAFYNTDQDTQELVVSPQAWDNNYLGQTWLDLSELRYIEYEQYDLDYKVNNWGKQIAGSKVRVYEWTRSEQPPELDTTPLDNILGEQPFARITDPLGDPTIRFTVKDEIDPVTNAVKTYYYFWQAQINVIPEGATRPYTALAMQNILADPDSQGVLWASPIEKNALLISNLDIFLHTRDKVIIRIIQKVNPEEQHINSVLVSEGVQGDVIPEYLFRRLRTSISGRDNYIKTFDLKYWEPNTTYEQGDYVISRDFYDISLSDQNYGDFDLPVLKTFDGGRDQVTEVFKSRISVNEAGDVVFADGTVFAQANDQQILLLQRANRVMVVGETFTSTTADVNEWRTYMLGRVLIPAGVTSLIKNVLEDDGQYRAIVLSRRRVPDIKVHPLRRYGNQYTPYAQTWYKDVIEARRCLVDAANGYLLGIPVVTFDHWDAHLREYLPIFGNWSKDLTRYWDFVDYVRPGYRPGQEQFVTSLANANLLTNRFIGLIDTTNNRLEESYFVDSVGTMTLVYKRNGTIQFNRAVWDGSLGDAWDRGPWDFFGWDEDGSELVESILNALRLDLLVGDYVGYFNLFFFNMVRESIRQIPNANWVTKTTYLDIATRNVNEFTEISTFFDRRDSSLEKYIDEVKPYHSHVSDSNSKFETVEDVNVNTTEIVTMKFEDKQMVLDGDGEEIITDEQGNVIQTIGSEVTSEIKEADTRPDNPEHWWEVKLFTPDGTPTGDQEVIPADEFLVAEFEILHLYPTDFNFTEVPEGDYAIIDNTDDVYLSPVEQVQTTQLNVARKIRQTVWQFTSEEDDLFVAEEDEEHCREMKRNETGEYSDRRRGRFSSIIPPKKTRPTPGGGGGGEDDGSFPGGGGGGEDDGAGG